MKFIELFAGIGGFRYGLESVDRTQNGGSKDITEVGGSEGYEKTKGTNAERGQFGEYSNNGGCEKQFTCVYANEWDKYAAQIYERNFNEKPDTRDIRTVSTSEIPEHDLLVGGFPCQAFSIAGKRRGFDDTRGTLFFEVARILKDKQPKYFILENVKGLLSHDNGNTFRTIITTLDDLGYDLQWQVLNSKNFGVPQNRERVFIIGHLRGTSRPEVFPIGKEPGEDTARIGEDISYCLDSNYHKGTNTAKRGRRQVIVEKVVGKVKVRKHIVNVEKLKKVLRDNRKPIKYLADKLKVNKTTVEHWFRTDSCFSIPDPDIWVELKNELGITTNEFDKPIMDFEIRDNSFDQSNRVYSSDGIAPTITTLTGGHQHSAINDGYSIRRLTPTECERLQGFPDGWTEGISDTQRYKCLGNAVTTNVVTAIGERLNIY